MYERYYGLRDRPFELTPNPKFLYLTPTHREALSTLQYGLAAAKAVTVLTGAAGTGKTTLLKTALESRVCHHVTALHLTNPRLTRSEFVHILARGFGLTSEAALSKAELLTQLEALVRERRARGEITALIVDEAQGLDSELLEEIRLLGNIETTSDKLLPLVLMGQPGLARRLEEARLSQLKQRVTLRCELRAFDADETAGYIFTRIAAAGGSATTLFTRDALAELHAHSQGIPRTLNVLCDNALISGYALARRTIDRQIVEEVARDFRLQRQQKERSEGRPDDWTGRSPAQHGTHPAPNGGSVARKDPPAARPGPAPKPLFERLRGKSPGASWPSALPRLGAIKRR